MFLFCLRWALFCHFRRLPVFPRYSLMQLVFFSISLTFCIQWMASLQLGLDLFCCFICKRITSRMFFFSLINITKNSVKFEKFWHNFVDKNLAANLKFCIFDLYLGIEFALNCWGLNLYFSGIFTEAIPCNYMTFFHSEVFIWKIHLRNRKRHDIFLNMIEFTTIETKWIIDHINGNLLKWFGNFFKRFLRAIRFV